MARRLLSLILAIMVSTAISIYGKDYTATFSNAGSETVLKILHKETGFDFIYQKDVIQGLKSKVNGTYTSTTPEGLLDKVVKGCLGLTWQMMDGSVILSKPNKQTEESKTPAAREGIIEGVVLDEMGEPLAGATVWVKSAPKSAVMADADGWFRINFKSDKKVKLVASYVGMKLTEVDWEGKPISIKMKDDENMLQDVVVTGYGIVDKRASTSAVTSIKAEDILRPDAISIDQMLEGQVPDLMFMSNSGESGVTPKIRIRGTSSIIGNREPLWVVDGIVVNDPVPISAEDLNDPDYVNRIGNGIAGLNPQDIERLDILKDASATALYGTKAANGVIVITTKRGHQGKPQVRYNNTFTFKTRPHYSDRSVDVMNSKERIALSRQLFEDRYEYSYYSSLVGYEGALSDLYSGVLSPEDFKREVAYLETVNTDWFDYLTHNSFSQQHNASVTGGGERGTYYASIGFMDNDDVIRGTTNRRYSAVMNLDINFSSIFSAQFSVKGNISEREYYQDAINPIAYAYGASRAIPAYNQDGSLHFYGRRERDYLSPHDYNIINELNNSGISQDQSSFTLDANLKFRFTDWLRGNAIFSFTSNHTNIDSYWGERTWYAAELRDANYGEDPGDESVMPHGGELTTNDTRNQSWTARLQLDANKYLGEDEEHNLSGSIGFEASSTKYKGYVNTARGYFPDRGMSFVEGINLDQYPMYKNWISSNVPAITDNKSNVVSAYATVSYNWRRMIFLNANARVDGSNNFGDRSNDKLLPIWSVSGSFDPAQLGFFRDQTWLDRFIFKASYGFQGNMLSSESPVMIIKKGPLDAFLGEFTSTVSRNPNPNLKWEKTTSVNLGFDLAFMNNRLEVEGDVYFKRTRDAFMTKTISTINGYETYVVNGGNISNDGFSVSVTGRPIQSRDWQWSISGSFSRTLNSVKSLPAGESYELEDFLNGNAIVRGQRIGTFYSYRFMGLSPVDGGPMFDDWHDHYQDLVGKNKYDTYTSVLVATGSREPYMSGSFSTRLRWKRLYFTAGFAYSLGAKTRLFGMYSKGVTDATGATLFAAGEILPENNLSKDYLDRWMIPGDESHTNIPAIIGPGHDSYFKYQNHWSANMGSVGVQRIADSYWDMYDYSDYRVVSADYLKLQTISISYEIPEQWITCIGLKRLEIHASGNNLHTWCDKKLKGQTPTQGGFTTIQLSDRPSYSFGINVTF